MKSGETHPRLMLRGGLHRLGALVAVVVLVGRAIVVVCREPPSVISYPPPATQDISQLNASDKRTGLGNDEDVVSTAERILEDGGGAEVDVRVVSLGLSGRRAVKVPLLEVLERLYGSIESLKYREHRTRASVPESPDLVPTVGPARITSPTRVTSSGPSPHRSQCFRLPREREAASRKPNKRQMKEAASPAQACLSGGLRRGGCVRPP